MSGELGEEKILKLWVVSKDIVESRNEIVNV